MRRSLKVKLSLIGAVLAVGAMADDLKANKGKADASFVEEAYVGSQAEVRLSQLALRQSTDPAVKQLAQQMIDDHTKANDALKQVAEGKGFTLPAEMSSTTGSKGSTGSSGSVGSSTDDQGTVTGERMGAGDNRMGAGDNHMGAGDNHMGTGATGSMGSVGSDTPGALGSGSAGTDTSGSRKDDTRAGSGSTGSASGSGAVSTTGTTGKVSNFAGFSTAQRQIMKKYDEISKKMGADFDKAYLSQLIDDHKKDIRLFEKESKSGNDSELKTWATNTLPTLRHHLEMVQTIDKDIRGRRTNTM